MDIIFNRELMNVPDGSTVLQVLEMNEMDYRTVVWINGRRLMQKDVFRVLVQPGDELRVIQPLGGG